MRIIIICIVAVAVSGILSAIYKKKWEKHLHVAVAFEQEHCFEGDTGTIRETVINEKWLPLPSLVIKFPIDKSIRYKEKENTNVTDKQYRSDCILARSYEKVTRTFAVTYLKRGYYSISHVELVAADFFYRFIFAKRKDNESEIYVYPKKTKVRQVEYAINKVMGEYATNRFLYEDPFAFKGIREYAPNDSMRRINWGASAKTGALMVNQYYDTNQPSLRIFFDLESEGMWELEELKEELIRIARTYLERCLSQGIPVELITNGTDMITKEEVRMSKKQEVTRQDAYLKKLARLGIKEITRPFYEVLKEEKAQAGEVSVLLSVCQNPVLKESYERYVGTASSGQWFICIKKDGEKKVASRKIPIVYGEVE